jgi:NADH-quinone oxidoreductase subunit J
MTLADLLFWILAIASCGGALGVLCAQNVVRMAFWLMVSLAGVAGLFFQLSADFLGAAQLLIYLGGTVVLLIFGVMLTATGPWSKWPISLKELLLGLVVTATLLSVMISAVSAVPWSVVAREQPSRVAGQDGATPSLSSAPVSTSSPVSTSPPELLDAGHTTLKLGWALIGLRPDALPAEDEPGRRPATGYLLAFELISVHLLIVLLGAAYLGRTKRRMSESEQPGAAT